MAEFTKDILQKKKRTERKEKNLKEDRLKPVNVEVSLCFPLNSATYRTRQKSQVKKGTCV